MSETTVRALGLSRPGARILFRPVHLIYRRGGIALGFPVWMRIGGTRIYCRRVPKAAPLGRRKIRTAAMTARYVAPAITIVVAPAGSRGA